jgi:hypothetical protein
MTKEGIFIYLCFFAYIKIDFFNVTYILVEVYISNEEETTFIYAPFKVTVKSGIKFFNFVTEAIKHQFPEIEFVNIIKIEVNKEEVKLDEDVPDSLKDPLHVICKMLSMFCSVFFFINFDLNMVFIIALFYIKN